jgi:nuclear pore complex protein Nup205
MAVNADFAKQAVFVAQQLECSERYAAGLLHTVLVQNPNVSPIDSIEYTLLEYHTYRRRFVDCLRYLFQAVSLSLTDDSNPLYHQLANYVRHQLFTPSSTTKAHLTTKILTHIQSLDQKLSKIQTAVQNAASNTQINNGMMMQSLYSNLGI